MNAYKLPVNFPVWIYLQLPDYVWSHLRYFPSGAQGTHLQPLDSIEKLTAVYLVLYLPAQIIILLWLAIQNIHNGTNMRKRESSNNLYLQIKQHIHWPVSLKALLHRIVSLALQEVIQVYQSLPSEKTRTNYYHKRNGSPPPWWKSDNVDWLIDMASCIINTTMAKEESSSIFIRKIVQRKTK